VDAATTDTIAVKSTERTWRISKLLLAASDCKRLTIVTSGKIHVSLSGSDSYNRVFALGIPEDREQSLPQRALRSALPVNLRRGFRVVRGVDSWLIDLRYAWRLPRRNPLFALTATLSLAIGIGANTTIFTVANALLFEPPSGVAAPARLVDGRSQDGRGFDNGSYRAISTSARGPRSTSRCRSTVACSSSRSACRWRPRCSRVSRRRCTRCDRKWSAA
jgi:hypothetical protein